MRQKPKRARTLETSQSWHRRRRRAVVCAADRREHASVRDSRARRDGGAYKLATGRTVRQLRPAREGVPNGITFAGACRSARTISSAVGTSGVRARESDLERGAAVTIVAARGARIRLTLERAPLLQRGGPGTAWLFVKCIGA